MTRYRFTNAMGGEWVNTPRPDRNRVRTNGARFERPKGEPSWIVGVAITVLAIAAGVAVITGLSSLRDEAPAGSSPSGLQSLSQEAV